MIDVVDVFGCILYEDCEVMKSLLIIFFNNIFKVL